MGWERTVFGTRAQPRYGSPVSIAVLAAIAIVLVLLGAWVVAVIVAVLAVGALLVRRMR
jgi:hypothetical protein